MQKQFGSTVWYHLNIVPYRSKKLTLTKIYQGMNSHKVYISVQHGWMHAWGKAADHHHSSPSHCNRNNNIWCLCMELYLDCKMVWELPLFDQSHQYIYTYQRLIKGPDHNDLICIHQTKLIRQDLLSNHPTSDWL